MTAEQVRDIIMPVEELKVQSEQAPPLFETVDLSGDPQGVILEATPNEPAPPYSCVGLSSSDVGLEGARGSSGVYTKWNHTLFGCFSDLPNCVLVCVCPCIVEALVTMKVRSVRLGVALCCLTLFAYALSQVYYILLGTAIFTAQIETIQFINDRQNKDSEDYSGDDSDYPSDYELISTFTHSFHSSGFWLAAQIFSVAAGIVIIARMIVAFVVRNRARRMFGIGSPDERFVELKDACSVFCCYSCSMCQLKSTLDTIDENLAANQRSSPDRNRNHDFFLRDQLA